MNSEFKKKLGAILAIFFCFVFKVRYGKHVIFGKNIIIGYKFKFRGPGKIIIDDNVNLWANKEPFEAHTYSPDALITIGKNSRLNGTSIQCRTSITIGERALIGSAIILDTDFHSVIPNHRNNPTFIKSKPISIGSNVWIAGQAAIMKGVKIGDDATIGFRAIVTKDVPSRTVVAGNPAKIIRQIPK